MKRLLGLIPVLFFFACQKQISPEAKNFHRPDDWYCIDQHLENDMQKNRERMPRYSALSQGMSEDVSRLLIESEEFFLNVWGHWFDALLPAWKAGLPIGCREFPWIANVPEFRPDFATPVPSDETQFENPWLLAASLEFSYLFRGRAAMIEKAKARIGDLHQADHFQCMTKHFLQSLVMLGEAVPMMEAEAAARDVHIPWHVYPLQIHTHITGLLFASEIDRKSEDLHRQGLPIVCNDLATIPLAH